MGNLTKLYRIKILAQSLDQVYFNTEVVGSILTSDLREMS